MKPITEAFRRPITCDFKPRVAVAAAEPWPWPLSNCRFGRRQEVGSSSSCSFYATWHCFVLMRICLSCQDRNAKTVLTVAETLAAVATTVLVAANTDTVLAAAKTILAAAKTILAAVKTVLAAAQLER